MSSQDTLNPNPFRPDVPTKHQDTEGVVHSDLELSTVKIKAEEICLVNSTLKTSKKNLKKLEKVMDTLNIIDVKKLNGIKEIMIDPLLHKIYYELWFMFTSELIHIQKDLILYFEYSFRREKQPLSNKEITDKMRLLIKPISVQFLKFKPPQIKLFVPEQIYNEF
ncbi:hypothetical protein WIV_gp009 [Wiseana iridescent virus]|uniref:Uncharacterized protein n=1 Tax=Wiseana iridescent virus TaxID=68347 RepID=G0T535_IRV9|nr:hypothetical protein WIV_gp009 [Wiseana iridescent virus]ADO00352.1 hypothetical protein [Wiseana iridescent virus]